MKIVKTPNMPKENYYTISITADSNDGDYITDITNLSEKSFNKAIPVLELLFTEYMGHHGLEQYYEDYDEGIVDYDIDEFFDIPYGEMGPCHSIENISIMFYDTDGKSYFITLEKD